MFEHLESENKKPGPKDRGGGNKKDAGAPIVKNYDKNRFSGEKTTFSREEKEVIDKEKKIVLSEISKDNEGKKKSSAGRNLVKSASAGGKDNFEDRIAGLRSKGKKRGFRYSLIGIIGSFFIMVAVLIAGYYIFAEVLNLTGEVGRQNNDSGFKSFLDPEGRCQDSCCLASLEKMNKFKYEEADESGNCPPGYVRKSLMCESSLRWCEPAPKEPAPAETKVNNKEAAPAESKDFEDDFLIGEGSFTDEGGEPGEDTGARGGEAAEIASTTDPEENLENAGIIGLDSDGDGLLDEEELIYGTDKNNPDSDGDNYLDGDEVLNGYNPLGKGKL